jgi:hypothetical protein
MCRQATVSLDTEKEQEGAKKSGAGDQLTANLQLIVTFPASQMNCSCILLSITDKTQSYTIFIIIVNALHVSGGFSAHHQELNNCTHTA